MQAQLAFLLAGAMVSWVPTQQNAPLPSAVPVYVLEDKPALGEYSDLRAFVEKLFELRLQAVASTHVVQSGETVPCEVQQGSPKELPDATGESAGRNAPASYPTFYLVRWSIGGRDTVEKVGTAPRSNALATYELSKVVNCRPQSIYQDNLPFSRSNALRNFEDAADALARELSDNLADKALVKVTDINVIGDAKNQYRATEFVPQFLRQRINDAETLRVWNKEPPKPTYTLRSQLRFSQANEGKITITAQFSAMSMEGEPRTIQIPARRVRMTQEKLIGFYLDASNAVVKELEDLRYRERAGLTQIPSQGGEVLVLRARQLLCIAQPPTPDCLPDAKAALLALNQAGQRPERHAEILELMGQAHFVAGEYAAAGEAFDEVLRGGTTLASGDRIQLLKSAGDSWFEAKDYVKAASNYQEAVQLGASTTTLPAALRLQSETRLRLVDSFLLSDQRMEALSSFLTSLEFARKWPNPAEVKKLSNDLNDELSRILDGIPDKEIGPAAEKVQTGLSNEPRSQATALYQLALRYSEHEDYSNARLLLLQVLRLEEQTYGASSNEVALTLNDLANQYAREGKNQDAEPFYMRALAILEKEEGPESLNSAAVISNLASTVAAEHRFSDAENLYRRALKIREKALGPDSSYVASTLNSLGTLYLQEGEYAKAAPLYQRALAIRKRAPGTQSADLALSLSNLGWLYGLQGRDAEAEQLLRQALSIRKKAFSGESPAVASVLDRLGFVLTNEGKFEEALSLLTRAWSIEKQNPRPGGPPSFTNLLLLHSYRGEYSEAESLLAQGVDVWKVTPIQEQAPALNNQGLLYLGEGKYAEAERLLSASLRDYQQITLPESPTVGIALKNLAELYRLSGDYSQSEKLYKQALEIWEKTLGPEHPNIAVGLNGLGLLYKAEGRYDEAESLLRQALAIREKTLGKNHWRLASSLLGLGDVRRLQKKLPDAEQFYNRVVKIWEQCQTAEHPDIAASLNGLALIRQTQHQYGEAESLAQRSFRIRERVFGQEHREIASSFSTEALIYREEGKYAEAIVMYRKALSMDEKMLGAEHPELVQILEEFADTLREGGHVGDAEPIDRRAEAIRAKYAHLPPK